jgi:hypothetical protein
MILLCNHTRTEFGKPRAYRTEQNFVEPTETRHTTCIELINHVVLNINRAPNSKNRKSLALQLNCGLWWCIQSQLLTVQEKRRCTVAIVTDYCRLQRQRLTRQTRPLVREGTPKMTKKVTLREKKLYGQKSHIWARHQDILTDWPSVAMWLWLWLRCLLLQCKPVLLCGLVRERGGVLLITCG